MADTPSPFRNDPPVLTAQAGPLAGQRWSIEGEMLIGRDTQCGIVIPDRQVSRYHARLEQDGEVVTVEDLGSKNGTYINGRRISEPAILEDGDVLQIALLQNFLFFVSDSTIGLDTHGLEIGSYPIPLPRSGEDPAVPVAGLYLEPQSRRVWVNGQELNPSLSVQQFRLLEILERRKGEVVTRQELIDGIWGAEEAVGVSEQAFDALVRRLRERLIQLDPQRNYILTVRGHGLRLLDS